ncbi:very long-chain acyl-CoA synthetase-like [Acipenser oxyrinchus oxyrinchus]|uniref:long-chain-fatty-acid--CoA ligase n=1 Tax=Acipenser oxyrinchus oxyrinchus TaxID=40147 RepID=A0AAD8CGB2_ACIOX|nr:very long-chain acyl-CoA synthetase-like [Acipenser oxyrinchus oxyrinchus]
MYILFTLLASVAILPLLLCSFCPYFVPDVLYVVKCIGRGIRIRSYAKKKPFYSTLEKFLEVVQKQPDKPFLVFENKTHSYLDADKQSNKVASALQKHAGLKQGDTVAMFLGNEPDFIWIWLALAKLGCAAALLNYNIRSKSLLHCFSCCGAHALIAAPELKGAVEDVLASLQEQNVSVFILSEESTTPGIESLNDKIHQASDQPLPQSLRSSITIKSAAVYIYTSGTTGLPKAAVITQERVWASSLFQGICGVNSEDVLYLNLPLYHSAGFLMGLDGSHRKRCITVVLRRKFSASKFWDDCRKHNVTVIQYIREVLRYLCNVPKKDSDRDHKVRLAFGNGARADTWKEFLKRFGDIQISECYGATEGNLGFVNYVGKVGAIGREIFLHKKLFPYVLIQYDTEREEPVRDSRGFCVPVPKGETGLFVKKITKVAPFIGYARNPQQTDKKQLRDVFEKGDLYFNSGDLLMVDHDNFVYFQDRIGDTFRWKGENVATTEVSDTLLMVDCIEEANVYGVAVPDHDGRIGMAAVKLGEAKQLECDKIYSHVVTYLPSYARPRFLRIQSSLEVTGTFKQMKVKLGEEGFNPAVVQDPLYFLNENEKTYVPMTQEMYNAIISKHVKL